jgi:hypothetical protein
VCDELILRHLSAQLVGVRAHGTELQYVELAALLADAALAVEHRPAVLELDEQRAEQQHGHHGQQQQRRHDQVERALRQRR